MLAASIWSWIAVILVGGLLVLACWGLVPLRRHQKRARASRLKLDAALREAAAREAADRPADDPGT